MKNFVYIPSYEKILTPYLLGGIIIILKIRCSAEIGGKYGIFQPAMVEWFCKMVEERKKNNDCTKEKKSW